MLEMPDWALARRRFVSAQRAIRYLRLLRGFVSVIPIPSELPRDRCRDANVTQLHSWSLLPDTAPASHAGVRV
ncbi:MAG TPA: hypothetical protein VMV53_03980 [Acidimicrobiales bacterium]|nr:hypothetical protein [Acidimicrobiales bacterium]